MQPVGNEEGPVGSQNGADRTWDVVMVMATLMMTVTLTEGMAFSSI